jgi:hypothetical protein
VVTNNLAYIAAAYAGLIIVDVTDPAHCVPVGGYQPSDVYWSGCWRVAVSGNYAYLATPSGLEIVDVSQPARPVRVGRFITAGYAHGVAVSPPYAYVADLTEGLLVIDVSDPAHCVQVGSYQTASQARDVRIMGSLALVLANVIEVIDVTDPAHCVRLGGFSDTPNDIAVQGSFAYVARGCFGLEVYDITDITHAVQIDGCALDYAGYCYTRGVTVSGNYAYVASQGLNVIDVSDPANCVRVFNCCGDASANAVTTSGRYVYLLGEQRLSVFDAADPTNCVLVGGYQLNAMTSAVSISGNYAYLADSYAGLQILDIADAAHPVLAGATLGNHAVDVTASDGIACVLGMGLQVFDISDPTNAVKVGGYSTGNYGAGLARLGDYAYVTDTYTGFHVLEITNPTNCTRVGGCAPGRGYWNGLVAANERAYFGFSGGGFAIVNVSDATNPTTLNLMNGYGSPLAISGDYLYVANGASVYIIDVSNPFDCKVLGTNNLPATVKDIAIAGERAYIACENAWLQLQVIDVSNPARGITVGSYHLNGTPSGLVVHSNYLFVAKGSAGLDVLQITVAPFIPPDSLVCSAGHWQFRVTGSPNQMLEIQASPDLSAWSTLGAWTNSSGNAIFVDPSTATGCRFYRARVLP